VLYYESVTLAQLEFVKAVAREKSFSRAAETCHVSQPSLSSAIAKLEDELGGRLFFRTTRQVSITPLGKQLLPLIADVLQSSSHLTAAAEAMQNPDVRLIRIGLSPLVSTPLLAQALRPFEKKHPAVKVVLKQCFLGDLRERVAGHALDLAVVPTGFFGREYRRCPFYSDTLQYLASEGAADDAVSPGPVKLEQVADETFVVTAEGCGLTPFVRSMFRKTRLRFHEYPGLALNHQVIEEWVGLGMGAGLLPRLKLTTQKSRAQPLISRNGKPVKLDYELAWHKSSPGGSQVTALIRHFREVVPKLIAGLVPAMD
jgi:DNA-binding transcriptional LysR family regulator